MNTFLIGLFAGMFIGYMVADLLTVESKITYHIRRLRAKHGSTIQVDAEAVQSPRMSRKARRSQRRLEKIKNKL